jgi:hypothetical protein
MHPRIVITGKTSHKAYFFAAKGSDYLISTRHTLGIENVFSRQLLGIENEKTTGLLPIYFEETTIFAL